MSLLPLFDSDDDLAPQAARLAPKLRALADQGVYFGTSSWKYEGWLGSIYVPDNYATRGKFSKKKFEAECIREYARVFPVVGGDFSFYQFPTPTYWERLFGATPRGLLFSLKVPEEITVRTWPTHARYGPRAGTPNENFLNGRLFEQLFAKPLKPHRDRVAVLMFEFGTLAKRDVPSLEDFLDLLAPFLAELPGGFRYGVELRNPEFLRPEYFEVLALHNVAHVFNAWTRMPALGDQINLPDAFTADFAVARALLPKGRTYEQAVAALQPYDATREPAPAAREALFQLADRGRKRRKPTFLMVNNRLEGNAPSTIEAVVGLLGLD